jgi:hypothetical protein
MRPVVLEDLRTSSTGRLSTPSATAASVAEPFWYRPTARIFHATMVRSSHA